MRFTHKDMPRAFRVPLGPWLVPILGILMCILLLISVTKGTAVRFGIWMVIGHIVYFSYGFRHAKMQLQTREDSFASVNELVPEVKYITPEPIDLNIGDEIIEEDTHL